MHTLQAVPSPRIPLEAFVEFDRAIYDNGSGIAASHRLDDYYESLAEQRRQRPNIPWPRQATIALTCRAPGVRQELEDFFEELTQFGFSESALEAF